MKRISVIGANSFIGKHLLQALSNEDVQVKALGRKYSPHNEAMAVAGKVEFFQGDLLEPESLHTFIVPDDVVVNLVYLSQATREENLVAIKNLADACVAKKAKRLIHISTAVVSGATPETEIHEDSPCVPVSEYQINKYAIEQLLLSYQPQFEVIILRPSAVFGPQGKNLLKLAHDLQHGSPIINYLKSCMMGCRTMNLVYVNNVVASILFLAAIADLENKHIFLISDHDHKNNYRDIEAYLLSRFYPQYYWLPVIELPRVFFRSLSVLLRKNQTNPKQIYLNRNLSALGFEKPITFQDGLNYFADWYLRDNKNEGFKC